MDPDNTLPLLSAAELRVLGSLIEKSKTTPDYYPMTLNALTAACNQKTSRHPVVDYDEETVVLALNSLKGQSLVSTAVGGTSRVTKYKHNFTTVHPLSDAELAVLCLLLLRGAQTPGELNTNSGRLHSFHSLQSVQEVLNKLAAEQPPFVRELARRPGQKEARYAHLLGETIEESGEQLPEEPARRHVSELESRVASLETELHAAKERIEKLEQTLRELMS